VRFLSIPEIASSHYLGTWYVHTYHSRPRGDAGTHVEFPGRRLPRGSPRSQGGSDSFVSFYQWRLAADKEPQKTAISTSLEPISDELHSCTSYERIDRIGRFSMRKKTAMGWYSNDAL